MSDLPVVPVDRSNAFMLYAAFTGDLERTAAALGVRAIDVLRIADEDAWNEKLKGILELKKSSKPGDIERAINRGLNFVQAHRFRMFVERVVVKLTGLSAEELDKYLFYAPDKKGVIYPKLSTRALADLASAVEKAHALTYLALSDTSADRAKRNEGAEGTIAAGEMHVKIAEAMQKAAQSQTPRAQLFDAQLQVGQAVIDAAKKPEKPENPNDNDDH